MTSLSPESLMTLFGLACLIIGLVMGHIFGYFSGYSKAKLNAKLQYINHLDTSIQQQEMDADRIRSRFYYNKMREHK